MYPPAAAAANIGGAPAPALVSICPEVPGPTATGSPEASYVIIWPSVPPAIFANVIALSTTFAVVTASFAKSAVTISPAVNTVGLLKVILPEPVLVFIVSTFNAVSYTHLTLPTKA